MPLQTLFDLFEFALEEKHKRDVRGVIGGLVINCPFDCPDDRLIKSKLRRNKVLRREAGGCPSSPPAPHLTLPLTPDNNNNNNKRNQRSQEKTTAPSSAAPRRSDPPRRLHVRFSHRPGPSWGGAARRREATLSWGPFRYPLLFS